jgi:dTDP-3-amino-3,4,6-trideoxy-alpha-D-glucose transaminase
MPVPFLALGLAEDTAAIEAALRRVVASGWFILGPEVEAFEREFARASGARHAVAVNSGTDAIALILRALDIGPGDEVITTPLTAAFTALAICMTGATPVFADVDPVRGTLAPVAVESVVSPRTRALLPVHLYGQPADMPALEELARRHGLALIEDCAQAHLATAGGRPVGTIGTAGAFSFYPTKNLGALGDGGAVVTNDSTLAERIRRLRNGGQARRYQHVEMGVNSRLDEMQAAILRARLPLLAGWTERRRTIAASYRDVLAGGTVVPLSELDAGHVYHLFVVRAADRAALQAHLAQADIGTLVHYPIPLHQQDAFRDVHHGPCPHAERLCAEVLSLPLHPGVSDADVREVAAAIHAFDSRAVPRRAR